MTTPHKLLLATYVNADVDATAEHVARLLERDYHVSFAHFFVNASNLAIGEIARALQVSAMYSEVNHRYYLTIEHNNNTIQIEGPITPKP